jgi:hypothetical protein
MFSILILILCLISPARVGAGQATSHFQVGITITGKPEASATSSGNPQPLRYRTKRLRSRPLTPNGNGSPK